MATPFAQTIVGDTFTRADAGNLGANWTNVTDATSTTTYGITSNAAKPVATGGRATAFWNANTFQNNQYAQVIAGGSATGTNVHLDGLVVRASAGGYYLFTWNLQTGAGTLQIAKVVSGTFTSLGLATDVGSGAAIGCLLRLEVAGTQLTAFVNGNQVVTASDSAISSGAPGIHGYMAAASPTAVMTNWEGGSLVSTTGTGGISSGGISNFTNQRIGGGVSN